jgi:hypothetical protein
LKKKTQRLHREKVFFESKCLTLLIDRCLDLRLGVMELVYLFDFGISFHFHSFIPFISFIFNVFQKSIDTKQKKLQCCLSFSYIFFGILAKTTWFWQQALCTKNVLYSKNLINKRFFIIRQLEEWGSPDFCQNGP